MECLVAYDTSVGRKKENNEDSLLIKVANTVLGEVTFSVVCDGMGGLDRGELASKEMILALSDWFHQEFPKLLQIGFSKENLYQQWNQVAQKVNSMLFEYGIVNRVCLGTTVTALLLAKNKYYIMHVGDTRVYCFRNKALQITQDHSFVQYEIANGRLTVEEARQHPKRNVLLQAIGTDKTVAVDFLDGTAKSGDLFLLCSDGFRNEVYEEEMLKVFKSNRCCEETELYQCVHSLLEENMKRLENDNITAIAIKIK